MWSSARRRVLPAGFFALFVLGCLIWQAATNLTQMGYELFGQRRSVLQRAFTAPLERRVEFSLHASGTPYEAYRVIEHNAEEDARVFFLAERSERAYRVYNRLSSLLYPRVLVFVCDSETDWRPRPDDLFGASYILAFDSTRDVRLLGARPLTDGDDFLLWKLEG